MPRTPFTRWLRLAAVVVASAVAAPLLPAQATTAAPPAATAAASGPRLGHSRVGVGPAIGLPAAGAVVPDARFAPHGASVHVAQDPVLRRRGVPQMVIGGVAIIGGAIIGDDVGTIVSLGGLAYGLYGLWLYLN